MVNTMPMNTIDESSRAIAQFNRFDKSAHGKAFQRRSLPYHGMKGIRSLFLPRGRQSGLDQLSSGCYPELCTQLSTNGVFMNT
ncbi:hypothetical protein, partial [Nitratidesulfovibrio sp. 1201_IL3209]|uniref:hypothetical protein n=1 Tax=Nitratidesulfovibrio sp. 1201_IL3209 TaxID=3084053 RepID=UPI002FD93CBF